MIKFEVVLDLQEVFPTKQSCIDYLEKHRWPDKVISPYDSTSEVYKLKDNWYMCSRTRKKFNVKTGTIFKNTKIPLRNWFYALLVLATHPNSISSRQLGKDIKVTQPSAWNLLKDLRSSLKQSNFIKRMLKGFVEMDETLVGGKNKNRHRDKKVPHSQGRSHKDKATIWGAIERNGYLITKVIPDVKRKTLEPRIRANVEEGSNVYTDELLSYKSLSKWYNHEIVIHRNKQYVNDKASTNTIESRWLGLKNVIRTHRWVSKKYLQSYVDGFTFYSNTNKRYSNQERFELALSSIMGKSPGYKELNN